MTGWIPVTDSFLDAILTAPRLLSAMLVLLAAMTIVIRSVPQKKARVPLLWALIGAMLVVVAVMLLKDVRC